MPELVERVRTALARRYTIERELGRGGMARVYVALDRRHARPVALKILPPELAAIIGPERFKREILITSRLTHPHILALHDSGEAAGALYYVMPLVQGESLRSRLDRAGGLPTDEAISIVQQVASALAHAHRAGIVHRDVTPNNILLSDGNALLADFGIARLLQSEGMTDTGLPLGTPMYRSPEQATGQREVDARSDIYSLGCVLYESLAGSAAQACLSNRFAQPVPPLTKLRPDTPRSVAEAVARAMSTKPEERFASADDFARALTTPTTPWRRRGIRRVAVAVTVALAATAAGFTIYRSRGPAFVNTRVLVGHFQNRTGDSSLDVVGEIADAYVSRGLAETQLVEVFDTDALMPDSAATNQDSRGIAHSFGAGVTLRGSYYRSGDSLYIESQIVDTRSGKLVMSPQPVAGRLDQRMQLVELLRQRLMAGFATLFGPGFEAWQAESLPPTYEAYKEVLAGDQASGAFDYPTAMRHYRLAIAMDSNYVGAKTRLLLSAALHATCATSDSVARQLADKRMRLAPVDRGRLDWGMAHCRGDWPAQLAAARAARAAAPRSISSNVALGITALELFRPQEALSVLLSLDPRRVSLTSAQRAVLADFTIYAYHELDDPQMELKTAREGLRVLPDAPGLRIEELIALARLGRLAEMTERRKAWLPRAEHPRTPGQVNLCLAAELKAHGHAAEGEVLIDEAAEWYRAHPVEEQTIPTPVPCSMLLLAPIYYQGRWNEARTYYLRILASDSSNEAAHAAMGAIAARRGDRDDAAAMDRWLAAHPSVRRGRSTYARARIAAILGDRERAMDLLQQAFNEGLNHRMFIHVDPDMEPLHDLPAYRQLFALKG